MLVKFRRFKRIAIFLALTLIFQISFPAITFALSGGPGQPETQGFSQISSDGLVDPFTGNFSYNIPLMDVGGYPINLSYSANSNMDQEASWVGLGWSLNPGNIDRILRGIPDDFNGDETISQMNIRDDVTTGLNAGPTVELIGAFNLGVDVGFFHNSYRGYGLEYGVSPGLSIGEYVGEDYVEKFGGSLSVNFNSQERLSLGLNLRSGLRFDSGLGGVHGFNFNAGFNSRRGFSDLSVKTNARFLGKKHKVSIDFLGYSDFTYFPPAEFQYRNDATAFQLSLGPKFIGGIFPSAKAKGYEIIQSIENRTISSNSFGTLFLHNAEEGSSDLLDYNSSSLTNYSHNNPYLSMAFGTPDIFNVSGQGISGQFKAHRNDVGVLAKPERNSIATPSDLAIDIGLSPFVVDGGVHVGTDISGSVTLANSTVWEPDVIFGGSGINEKLNYDSNNDFTENVYFKGVGEKVYYDQSFDNKLFGEEPSHLAISAEPSTYAVIGYEQVGFPDRLFASNNFVNNENTSGPSISSKLAKHQNDRANRVNNFSYLTAAQATHSAVREIRSYSGPADNISISGTIPRVTEHKRPHHISEISVLNNSGARYIYGLPVYNLNQRDYSFNTENSPTSDDGIVEFNAGENTLNNSAGRNDFYRSENIPGYAHSYLLTNLLSDNYIDVNQNGPDKEDIGDYVNFNYHSEYTEDDPYFWRSPISGASYDENRFSKGDDNQASYSYGEKEIWYLHSIESKKMKAVFYLFETERKDALSVLEGADSFGGLPAPADYKRSRYLEKIELYANHETESGESLTPIKTIHFKYNNSLCQGLANSTGLAGEKGKLTLEKVWFTYGNSDRGQLNAYEFTYGIDGSSANPNYGMRDVDRWGVYKSSEDINYFNYPEDLPPTEDFPYSIQDKDTRDLDAQSWNLTNIKLPSGANISVDYESDDYAFVQNKRAGQMYFIEGFSRKEGGNFVTPSGHLYQSQGSAHVNYTPNDYLVIQVEDLEPGDPKQIDTVEEFEDHYLQDVESIFYKVFINLLDDFNTQDYISGYMSIDEDRDVEMNGLNFFIPIETIEVKGKDFNPITFNSLQKMTYDFPEHIYPGFDDDISFESLLGIGKDIANLFKGYFNNSVSNDWSRDFNRDKSWVRLANHSYCKLGGDSRVSKISINDNWNKFNYLNDGESTYGQEYSYKTDITLNGVTKSISSGVATYEPLAGGEENLFRNPVEYPVEKRGLQDLRLYEELPIGEALFPSASVGYSKVKITPFGSFKNSEILKKEIGYKVNSYYTANDFPLSTKNTELLTVTDFDPSIIKFLKVFNYESLAGSQGFVVETNDMHGKPWMMESFNVDNERMNRTTYQYKESNETGESRKIESVVNTIDNTGSFSTAELGKDMEVWQEMNKSATSTISGRFKINLDVAVFPPELLPGLYASAEFNGKVLAQAVTTKHVKRCGILDKVIVENLGSSIITENVAFDDITGQPILTKTQNEFGDKIYNLNYPAHWVYEGMGPAFTNLSVEKSFSPQFSSDIENTFTQFLKEGDEILLIFMDDQGNETDVYPRIIVNNQVDSDNLLLRDPLNNDLCIEFDGQNLPAEIYFKVLRSGSRNLLASNVGGIAFKGPDQLNITPSSNIAQFNGASTDYNIIQSAASTFKKRWQMNCPFQIFNTSEEGAVNLGDYAEEEINPVKEGLLNSWRPYESFAYLGAREHSNNSIRNDGYINSDFNFLWGYDGTNWIKDETNWELANKITIRDLNGNELENIDALDNFSSAIFRYNECLPVAIAANARYREILNENFEDYKFGFIGNTNYDETTSIVDGFVDFEKLIDSNTDIDITDEKSHTGVYSLSVQPEKGFEISFRTINEHLIVDSDGDPICDDFEGFFTSNSNNLRRQTTTCTNDLLGEACGICIPHHYFEAGNDFTLSFWIATNNSIKFGNFNNNDPVEVVVDEFGNTISLISDGPVVDGWQKFEADFTPTLTGDYSNLTNLSYLVLGIENNESEKMYIDDLRIHPKDSYMNTYVYDPFSLRLMAELDENNYATIYEYNDEGILVRTKIETERGVQTVSESRSELAPNN